MWKCSCGHENPNSARWCESCYAKGADQQSYIQAQGKEYAKKRDQERREQDQLAQRKQYEENQERLRKEQETVDEFLKENGHEGFYEYKVVDIRDNNSGAIDVYDATELLNSLGRNGWRLKCAYSNELGHNSTPGFTTTINSTIDQNILIFERFIKFK